ncbi:MAG: hypothetical protein QOK30_1706 [Nocardioidaceae bacterium]|nr:hypothetical protein [Nocardioidaceae bacterium]
MNIDELRQTLSTMAEEVDSVDAPARLRAVDAKVVRGRRQRIGAGVACAAVAAVVGLVVPGLVDAGGDGPRPANNPTTSTSETTLPTVEDKGTRFYTSPAGDTLLGEAMGRTGSRSVTLRVVPATSDLSYRSVCWQPDPSRTGRLVYDVSVNGKPVTSTSCDRRPFGPLGPDSSFGSGSPRANISSWRDLGVVPGKAMTVRLSVRPDISARTADSTQLGVAVYANTGARDQTFGVWTPKETVTGGHTYKRVNRVFRVVLGRRGHLRLHLNDVGQPLYVVYGVGRAHSAYDLRGDTSGGYSASAGPSSYGELSTPGQRAAHASVRLHGEPGAVLYILVYRQVG